MIAVGKQGERGEAKLSTRQTRLETRWREMKEIEKSETREDRKNPVTHLQRYAPIKIIGIKIIVPIKSENH